MSTEDRELSQLELGVGSALDDILDRLYAGDIASVGVCGTGADGAEFFFYLDGTAAKEQLRGPLNKLLGLYEMNARAAKRTTAPQTNRSYRSN